MIPVIFIPGWPDETISAYTKRLALQTPGNSARWRKIYATSDPSEARYAICQDNPISIRLARQHGFRKSQIIYIKREADSALPPIDKDSVLLTYQGSDKLIPAVWWLSIPFDELSKLSYPEKHNTCSAIVSSCSNLPGHRRRLTFINALAKYSEIDIDIFGRGHRPGSFYNRYRGELVDTGRCKRNGLLKYNYSICIENTQENGYITEKFNDAVLCFALPIYHGAPNINSYYPQESYINLPDITSGFNIDKVLDLTQEVPNSEELAALRNARELLLYKYNIWNIVNALVLDAHT